MWLTWKAGIMDKHEEHWLVLKGLHGLPHPIWWGCWTRPDQQKHNLWKLPHKHWNLVDPVNTHTSVLKLMPFLPAKQMPTHRLYCIVFIHLY